MAKNDKKLKEQEVILKLDVACDIFAITKEFWKSWSIK